jgi:hypothetical protein
MDTNSRAWVDYAIDKCAHAKQSGVALLMRNDDDEIVVCSEINSLAIRELGQALTAEYVAES